MFYYYYCFYKICFYIVIARKAIKIIPEINLPSNILNEAEIMKRLNNAFIIRFFDSFKELHFSALVTEYCEV